MKIKRKFAYVSGARKFKVYINGVYFEDLKLFRTIEVERPQGPFTLSFSSMMFEKSKTYLIDTNKDIYITANINPLVRLFTFSIFLLYGFVFYFMGSIGFPFVIYLIFGSLVLYLIFYYGFFVKRYIVCKVFDLDGNKIDVTID